MPKEAEHLLETLVEEALGKTFIPPLLRRLAVLENRTTRMRCGLEEEAARSAERTNRLEKKLTDLETRTTAVVANIQNRIENLEKQFLLSPDVSGANRRGYAWEKAEWNKLWMAYWDQCEALAQQHGRTTGAIDAAIRKMLERGKP